MENERTPKNKRKPELIDRLNVGEYVDVFSYYEK
jgi:hypothetical protein